MSSADSLRLPDGLVGHAGEQLSNGHVKPAHRFHRTGSEKRQELLSNRRRVRASPVGKQRDPQCEAAGPDVDDGTIHAIHGGPRH